jgi:thymidylate synthase (FAD)
MNVLEANIEAKEFRSNQGAENLLGLYFPVLDNGFCSLIDYMGNDACIAQAARCSYGAGTRSISNNKGLIRYLINHAHCYHPDMEVLTSKGWKKWKHCEEVESFIVPDPKNNKTYIENLIVKKFKYNDDLIKYKNSRMNFSITKNHKLFFRKKTLKSENEYQLYNADSVSWGHFKSISKMSLYEFKSFDDKKNKEYEFIGFYLGDGSYASTNRISFHIKKDRKIKYLRSLIEDLKLNCRECKSSTHEDAVVFYINIPAFLKKSINVKFKSFDKCFDTDLKNLNKEQALGLLFGLINSDGSIKKNRQQIEFSSVSENLTTTFETLCAAFGIECHRCKSIGSFSTKAYLNREELESRKKYWSKEKYCGDVFCTTTSTGLLLVRGSNNSCAFICGNSSPLEMVELKFHMKLPIFVARQIVRHRVANLNELSGRYSIMPLQFYTPEHKDFQYQSTDNKQGRNGIVDEDLYDNWISDHVDLRKYCGDLYVKDLKNETAREIARIDLPLSTYTEWYWKMDLHNLFHFLKLRCDEHAQFETREYANIIAAMVSKVVPISFEAWQDYNYCAKSFSYQDLLALKNLLSEDPWIKSHPCDDLGMTKREIEEFFAKVSAPADKPNFNLDMSLAKSPSYFREESEKCVPEIDGSKP